MQVSPLDETNPPSGLERMSVEEQDDGGIEDHNPLAAASDRKKALVLLGSAVLQLPIWGAKLPMADLTAWANPHNDRFRDELWCLSRILHYSLAIEGQPRIYRSHRHNLQWSHIPLDACIVLTLYQEVGT